jgi:eukaryotic-like serine/threonine-protein kinase
MPAFIRRRRAVSRLSDAVLAHLRTVTQAPDPSGPRYDLGDEIGRGGMGIVYRAHDRELDRPIALKVLNPLPDHAQAEARLVQEARIIARLEHPSIVPVHDAGRLPDGRLYYAMKLVRGRRLDEPGEQPTTLAERLRIFLKICDAVAFAHAHGVLHRDLKPQNVMIGPFGEVLVMDWGVAKAVGFTSPVEGPDGNWTGPAAHTAHGTVVGTPGYMAPEQARGEVLDERADVYGLGAILYFLLTDRAPEQGVLPPPRRHDRSIPRPLEAACLKALAPDPAARYPGVADMADDVTRFLGGLRVHAYRESVFESVWRLGVRYRAVVALVLAYILMRILLLIFARG